MIIIGTGVGDFHSTRRLESSCVVYQVWGPYYLDVWRCFDIWCVNITKYMGITQQDRELIEIQLETGLWECRSKQRKYNTKFSHHPPWESGYMACSTEVVTVRTSREKKIEKYKISHHPPWKSRYRALSTEVVMKRENIETKKWYESFPPPNPGRASIWLAQLQ